MSTRHQEYLYHSRRKRPTKMFRLAGEKNSNPPKAKSYRNNQQVEQISVRTTDTFTKEKRSLSGAIFMIFPLIVTFEIIFGQPYVFLVSILLLGLILVYFYQNTKSNS